MKDFLSVLGQCLVVFAIWLVLMLGLSYVALRFAGDESTTCTIYLAESQQEDDIPPTTCDIRRLP
jgi:hypothetical protein